MCMSVPKAQTPNPPPPPPIPLLKPQAISPAVPQSDKNKASRLGVGQLIIPAPKINIPR